MEYQDEDAKTRIPLTVLNIDKEMDKFYNCKKYSEQSLSDHVLNTNLTSRQSAGASSPR